jgi:hypothetical protein
MSNRVNHPEYYKKKNGIETIEVIRHYVCDIANAQKYLMRAGEKPEQGMTAEEKEVEDLRKALWYIHDVRKHRLSILFTAEAVKIPTMLLKIFDTTGHEVANITKGFNEHISKALRRLLLVGLISDGKIYCCRTPTVCLSEATQEIQQRILEIEIKNKE